MSTPEIEALKAALLGRLSDLIHALYGDRAIWRGHEWRIGDVRGEPGSSLAIEGKDPARLGLWHDHNSAAELRGGDVLNLIAGAQATDFKGAAAWAKAFLGDVELPPAPVRPQAAVSYRHSTDLRDRDGELLKPAKPRSLTQASNALFKHKRAMAQLRKRCLTVATVRHFRLSLYSYEGTQTRVKDALSAPVLDANGVPLKRSLFSRLPKVTEGGPSPDAKDWCIGSPGTYWVTPREGRTELFVCEGAKDGWWLWQALQGSSLSERLCIITSTHGSAIPEAWKSLKFWRGWGKVYLGQDADEAGDALADRVRQLAGRDVYRVRVPGDYGKDWTDFFQSGQTVEDFAALVEAARIFDVSVQLLSAPRLSPGDGTYTVIPVDVSRTYVQGHLYVPFRAVERQVQSRDRANGERNVQRYRTLVMRSDGAMCTFGYLPAPRGTPKADRVLALSDGTLISRPPVVDGARPTFGLTAITRFGEARASGRSAMTMTPRELLEGIHDYLQASVSLPHQEDYALLAYVAVASYAQAIFDAVPLVRIVGPPGSGKTALGRALVAVGCNAALITGKSSVAVAVRILDRLGDLAVIDDLEVIGQHSGGDEFGAFVRQLCGSGRKDTATAIWTDSKTARVESLDFYGVKVVIGTSNADLLSTPTLRVYTRTLPKGASARPERRLLPTPQLQELRDNLHVWVMESVERIDALYREAYNRHSNPQEAMKAPLKVVAQLLGHPALYAQLQAALALQEREPPEAMSSVQLVRAALRSLIRQGYWKKLTLKQLMLEMHLLTSDDLGEVSNTASPEWREPRWVGRTLRAEKLINTSAKDERRWLWGEQTRVVTLEPGFVADVLSGIDAQSVAYVPSVRGPLEFCLLRPCGECPYAGFCTMRPRKEKH